MTPHLKCAPSTLPSWEPDVPIAFPPYELGPAFAPDNDVEQSAPDYDVTNLGNVGVPFDFRSLNPGFPFDWPLNRAVNLRNIGADYEDPTLSSRINGAFDNGVPQVGFYQTDWAQSNRAITGISRDSTGTILGLCRIELYITSNDQPVYTVTSDASGNFSFGNPGTGPFYIVAYKVGSPDVAGTTVNTLLPT